jgi:hypothetical protein
MEGSFRYYCFFDLQRIVIPPDLQLLCYLTSTRIPSVLAIYSRLGHPGNEAVIYNIMPNTTILPGLETQINIPGHTSQATKDNTSISRDNSEAYEGYSRPEFHARKVYV